MVNLKVLRGALIFIFESFTTQDIIDLNFSMFLPVYTVGDAKKTAKHISFNSNIIHTNCRQEIYSLSAYLSLLMKHQVEIGNRFIGTKFIKK